MNANNKGMITKDEFNRFNTLYKHVISAKGNQSRKSQIIKEARDVYREVLFTKLKDAFKNQSWYFLTFKAKTPKEKLP